MRFLSDENFRADVVQFLRGRGHDVKIAPKGSLDPHIAALARREKRVLLTNDTDFSISLQFPPRDYPGIFVFRIHPPRFEKFKNALEGFLSHYGSKRIKGKTFVIQEDSFLEIE